MIFPGSFIYAVNGPTSQMIPVQGFTLNPLTESIVDHWDSFSQVIYVYPLFNILS